MSLQFLEKHKTPWKSQRAENLQAQRFDITYHKLITSPNNKAILHLHLYLHIFISVL